jgi:hypothetical protein
MDINSAVGGNAGLARGKIEVALGLTDAVDLSERERAALEYAERGSDTPVDVPDEFFARLRQLFSEREIVELTAQIASENYNAKMNRPLRVESKFCAAARVRRMVGEGLLRADSNGGPCWPGRREASGSGRNGRPPSQAIGA